jgi:hypothetical protein
VSPTAAWVTNPPVSATAAAASRPARTLARGEDAWAVSRRATTKASSTAAAAPARATASQRSGAAPPDGARSVVTATGSGFQAGPSTVLSEPPAISRPHSSQAQAS